MMEIGFTLLRGNKTYYIGLGYGWMDVSETVCDLTITKKEDAPDISSTSLELGSMDYNYIGCSRCI